MKGVLAKERPKSFQGRAGRRHGEFRRILRVFFGRKLAVCGLVIILLLILCAIFAPFIATHDPYKTDLGRKLLNPNGEHLLGTDPVGRDLFSRILYGARTSLLIGITAVGSAAILGVLLGLIAGYYGGWVHTLIMRIIDAFMAIPGLMLALLISGLVGGGTKIVIFAMAIWQFPGLCRLMCGQVLSVKENEYVLAARAIGMSDLRIMFTQILPNAFPPILVALTLGMGGVILGEAGLSFLGIGVKPPTCAWGSMIQQGYPYLLTNPVLSIAPGVAIMLTVFGFNMVGDGLRDAIDPRLRGVLR